MIYLDTSWLVKLYVDEGDTEAVRRVVDADPTVLVSELAFVEFHAAVARRRRERSHAPRAATTVVSRFRREWTDRGRIAVSHDVVARAAELVTAHPLRSLDALHLASALLVRQGGAGAAALRRPPIRASSTAARAEGLATLTTD